MSLSKGRHPIGKIMLWGATTCILTLPFLEPSGAAAAGGMGDTSAPMRANMAAYPEFFAPKPDPDSEPSPHRVQRCKDPLGVASSDRNCKRR